MDNSPAAVYARHQAFEADPQAWKDFLGRVAAGETPTKICDELGLNLFSLNMWIREDKDMSAMGRRGLLTEALESRSEAIRWRIEDQWMMIGFFDIRLLFDDEGNLKRIPEWPKEIGAAVAGLDVEDLYDTVDGATDKAKVLIGYLKKFKVWDKLKALDSLGKQHGMLKDKNVERVADSLEALLQKSFDE